MIRGPFSLLISLPNAHSFQSKGDTDGFFVLDTGNADEAPPAPSTNGKGIAEKSNSSTHGGTSDTNLVDEGLQKLLDKAVCGPSFEKNYGETAKLMGRRAMKRLRKMEREKTKGRDWFDLPASELTEEAKADLELLQMRSAIDPLAFYRRNDRKVLPKYFQVGRVVDAPEDFYSSRMPKKDRKRTMLDELLNDQRLTQQKREKYNAIQEREKRKRRGAFQHSGPRRSRKEKTTGRKRKE
ncbi:Fcf2 pre-rRNA processing [Teladorsagia circumcincta]|uniref:Fcf2 pre-rRNA processing n=1 Tax=Teladorsagia circumcincta TaxID=45464 RepID=A0A2G9UUP1_TELCI|nr:Fcf2 pre-rRNA processing [Teladorsagia circumcincta]